MSINQSRGFQWTASIFLLFLAILFILPFILLFMSSITEENTLLTNGYSFFPAVISFESYAYILNSSDKILRAYGITIFVTVVGTAVNLTLSSLIAYPLSLKKMPFRRAITFFVFFTMLFNGGLIPTYITYSTIFKIKDTIFAQIVPFFLMNAINVLLIKAYFQASIPDSLLEAAEIDGAGHFRIFRIVVVPLGKPILVTLGIFTAVAYWNDWTNGLYFISKRTDLYNIQNLLNKMISDLQFLTTNRNVGSDISAAISKIPATGVQMAIAFVAMIPVLIIFPFLHKYYVKGIALGAIKG